jgi:hypothetical protein
MQPPIPMTEAAIFLGKLFAQVAYSALPAFGNKIAGISGKRAKHW